MIGIDTNILPRHTLDDEAGQSALASAFLIDAARLAEPALVNSVVLVEFVWTLARRKRFEPGTTREVVLVGAVWRGPDGVGVPGRSDGEAIGRFFYSKFLSVGNG